MKQVGAWLKEYGLVAAIVIGWFSFILFMALKFGI